MTGIGNRDRGSHHESGAEGALSVDDGAHIAEDAEAVLGENQPGSDVVGASIGQANWPAKTEELEQVIEGLNEILGA